MQQEKTITKEDVKDRYEELSVFIQDSTSTVEGLRKKEFEIRRGKKGKLFTLWVVSSGPSFCHEQFIKSLSNNPKESWNKAVDHVFKYVPGKNQITLEFLTKSVREWDSDFNCFPFGKYEGQSFEEVQNDSYKKWFVGVLKEKSEAGMNVNQYYNLYNHLINDRGFVENNGRLITAEEKEKLDDKSNFWESLKSSSNFQGQIGDQLSFKRLKILLQTGYWQKFGYHENFVGVTVMHDEDSNVFVYKGSVDVVGEPGSVVYVKGEVKQHTVYNGINQTVLGKIKAIDITTFCPRLLEHVVEKEKEFDSYIDAVNDSNFREELKSEMLSKKTIPKKYIDFAFQVMPDVIQNVVGRNY